MADCLDDAGCKAKGARMTDDLIERLRGYGDGNNDLMDAAADRIEKLGAALHNVTSSWDLWQKAIDSKSFTELFACICAAKALEGEDDE